MGKYVRLFVFQLIAMVLAYILLIGAEKKVTLQAFYFGLSVASSVTLANFILDKLISKYKDKIRNKWNNFIFNRELRLIKKIIKFIILFFALIAIVNIVFIRIETLWINVIEFIVIIVFFINSLIYFIDKR